MYQIDYGYICIEADFQTKSTFLSQMLLFYIKLNFHLYPKPQGWTYSLHEISRLTVLFIALISITDNTVILTLIPSIKVNSSYTSQCYS